MSRLSSRLQAVIRQPRGAATSRRCPVTVWRCGAGGRMDGPLRACAADGAAVDAGALRRAPGDGAAHGARLEAGRPIALASQEVLDGTLAGASKDQRARFGVLTADTGQADQVDRRKLLKLGAAGVALATGKLTLGPAGPAAPELVGHFRPQLDGHYRADMLLGAHHLVDTVAAQYAFMSGLTATATADVRPDLLALQSRMRRWRAGCGRTPAIPRGPPAGGARHWRWPTGAGIPSSSATA